ncbi:MAG: hypothetical protein PHV30_05525 [Candidatus Margulisbacteria bacterium]|nr:hypothetical protein [Candidatus Margulisiibacteriota bacterium]
MSGKVPKGYLLLETVIALFLLSVIILPWIGFIRQSNSQQVVNDLQQFFATKKVFLQVLNGEINEPPLRSGMERYIIKKIPLDNNLYQLQVDLVINGKIKYSLVGIAQ